MTQHNTTIRNPYRRGSAMNPTFYQRELAVRSYMEEHPNTTEDEACSIVDELFRDFVEEHD